MKRLGIIAATAAIVVSSLAFAQSTIPGAIGDMVYNSLLLNNNLTVTGTTTFNGPVATASVNNYGVDAGSNDTYVATLTPAPTTYVAGRLYVLKAATANTGAASVNFNGIGAATIVKGVSTTLANNDILAGMLCLLVYDGTNMVLLNPRAL